MQISTYSIRRAKFCTSNIDWVWVFQSYMRSMSKVPGCSLDITEVLLWQLAIWFGGQQVLWWRQRRKTKVRRENELLFISQCPKKPWLCAIFMRLCPHRANIHTFVVEVSAGCQPAGMDDFCKTFKCHLVQQRAFFFFKYRWLFSISSSASTFSRH